MFAQKKLLSILVASACSTSVVYAEETTVTTTTNTAEKEKVSVVAPVVVTATRIGERSFDLPVAIDLVSKDNIQAGQPGMTLSESLIRVPGITAQNRTQMAQDPQISTRGFGARSAFGVRGVRVYVDGIPLTMPDGQGQPGNVDLDVLSGVEVMRGPFSALYGNSSGGVIQMLTANAPKTPEVSAGVMFGSYGTEKESVRAAGTSEGIEYLVNYSNYQSDGYRDHSANEKKQGTAKFKINFSEDTKLTTLVNWFDQDADDPLGATKAMLDGSRKDVVPAALRANTRVSRQNTQVGFNLEHRINEHNSLNIISYVGTRDNLQILPTNALGTNARASQIEREFYGTDIRWNNQGTIIDRPYTFSLGATYGKSSDDRTDTNILAGGLPVNVLNRNEENISKNFDQYAQAKFGILDNLDLHAGIRRTKVRLEINDKLIVLPGNPDNSGNLEYQKTTPVIGAVWKITPVFNLYANYGKGFETPTFVEVAYANPTLISTPNFNLKPSESRNLEIGGKAFLTDNTIANLTLFKTWTDDEIIIQNVSVTNITSYTNANKTKRNGLEASIESKLPNNITLYGAYTLLNAKFDSDFTNNSGLIEAGNIIPGTYHTQIYGEASWRHEATGFRTAFEARHNSKTYVNDLNTDSAPSYTIFNIRAGFEQKLKNWRFSEYARIENIFDKEYIGSVKLNDYANGRYYEPSAGRNWLMGLNATYSF